MLCKRSSALIRSIDSKIPYLGKFKASSQFSQYAIGFVDDKKKRINLVPVNSFEVHRFLENDAKGELFGLNTNAEGFEHREMIVQEIGTKKGKKILQQIKNKVIKEDAIFSAVETKEIMAQKAEDIQNELEHNSLSHFQKEIERKKQFLPDFNISAKSAAKIYSIDSIMPKQDIQNLDLSLVDNQYFIHEYVGQLKSSINWSALTLEQAAHKKTLLIYLHDSTVT